MSLVKIYGILDLCSAVVLVLMQFYSAAWRLSLGLAFYLIIKSAIYIKDFMSWIDLGVAAYMIILLWQGSIILTLIFAGYLTIKGIWSLF